MKLFILLVLCLGACMGNSADSFSISDLMHIGYVGKEVAIKVADQLISLKCVNKLDGGNSILHMCAKKGSLGCVKKCLRNGADVNITDKSNKTALDYAKEKDYSIIAEEITKAMSQKKRDISIGCQLDEVSLNKIKENAIKERVDEIIAVGIDKTMPDGHRETVLIKWTKTNFVIGVAVLLEAGADPHIRDERNKSAFDYAVQYGYWAIAEKLRNSNNKLEQPNDEIA